MHYNISVIIPTLNEEAHIENILSDLFSQTMPPSEVIIVDGHSHDTTTTIIKSFTKARLLSTKPNAAHQRHVGAMEATGNLLIFLDADTRVPPQFLENIQRIFTTTDIDFACPWYIPSPSHLESVLLYAFFNTIFFTVQKLMPCGAGSCIIVKRSLYTKAKGFDQRYIFDDMHFLSKAKKYGKFAFLPQKVYVSDRRVQKLGGLKAFLLYVRLSWYFIRNDFDGANTVHYPFAAYTK